MDGDGLQVLVVDDSAMVRQVMQSILSTDRRIGVKAAADPLIAWAKMQKDPPDVVITDLEMPRMDGLELISRLRGHAPSLPIVLLSGFSETLGLGESSTGADVVLQKSANEVSHLVRAVNRLLRRKPARKPPTGEAPLKVKRKTV